MLSALLTRRVWVVVTLLALVSFAPAVAQDTRVDAPSAEPADTFLRSSRLGITFVNSIDTPNAETRYRNALSLGAGWTRWPLYWDRVEIRPGVFDWSAYDALVTADLDHNLRSDVVLLGIPGFHRQDTTIAGLHTPIFADGTDTPGPRKTINPDNPWANFVYQAVRRYMPGGTLGWLRGWPDERGITVWEIWNEPDHPQFWQGTVGDYARLLKIAHIVAHHLDPDTTVMMGGLLYPTRNNWLAQVLGILIDDPFYEQHNFFVDAVAVHSYGNAWRSGWLTLYVRQTLIAYEIDRPIWLNESGVAAWDDYPGPTWLAEDPDRRQTMATAEQQAAFFIQSSAYAWAEGADVVFYHQLYDDCGDQPPGTNFPPHDGALCEAGDICFGDAFGIFRNGPDSICYSRHPEPNSPRPVARAYELLAKVFGSVPFSRRGQVDERPNESVVITFTRPTTNERVIVAWNTSQEPLTLELDAVSATASLYTLENESSLRAVEGKYRLRLAPALSPSRRFSDSGGAVDIGGPPVILVEALDGPPPVTTETESTPQRTEPAGGAVYLSAEEIDALIAASPTGVAFTSLNASRLRSAPTTEGSQVLNTMPVGNSASVIGRTEDGGWVQIDYEGRLVWVAAFLGMIHGDLDSVPVVEVPRPAAPPASTPNADPLQSMTIGGG